MNFNNHPQDDFDTILEKERRASIRKPVFTPQRTQAGWDQNRLDYQKMSERATQCLTPDVDLNNYEPTEYLAGNHPTKHEGLKWGHFDFVSLIGRSRNPITQKLHYQFVGTRDEVSTVVLAKKIK